MAATCFLEVFLRILAAIVAAVYARLLRIRALRAIFGVCARIALHMTTVSAPFVIGGGKDGRRERGEGVN